MRVLVVDERLTIGGDPAAAAWQQKLTDELNRFLDVQPVSQLEQFAMLTPTRDDAIVFFNRQDQSYSRLFLEFLSEAKGAHPRIVPIALDQKSLHPPEVVEAAQSFDVSAGLRQRDLPPSCAPVLAEVLARQLAAYLRPSLCKEHLEVFLSYRRFDGERVAEAFDRQFRARAERVFRDRIDVRAGEDSQEVIIERLRRSDLVVFVDTPRSGESEWIAKELRTALGMQIPIVWVRFGPNDGRTPLSVTPGRQPHILLDQVPATQDDVEPELVDKVLEQAARTAGETTSRLFGQLKRLQSIAGPGQVQVREIDKAHLVYSVSFPHKGCSPFRYPQRPITHIVQFFNRWPAGTDAGLMAPHLERIGVKPHEVFGLPYDAAILLAPIPPQSQEAGKPAPVIIDSVEEYVSALARHVAPRHATQPTDGQPPSSVIISGAFPDSQPEYEQNLTDAIHAICRAVFSRGVSVVFGNHPTFRPLISEVASRFEPKNPRAIIRMYTSRYFVSPAEVEALDREAHVLATPSIDDDRARSLSEMRKQMIADGSALALVAIGGKTGRAAIPPGVDEEVRLATERKLPVFVLGAVGGRSAEIAAELSAAGWKPSLNPLSPEDNERLRLSTDFDDLAELILTALGR